MAVVEGREEEWSGKVRMIDGTLLWEAEAKKWSWFGEAEGKKGAWFWEVGERDGTRGWWSMVVRKEKGTGGQGWVDYRSGPCMGANPVGVWV